MGGYHSPYTGGFTAAQMAAAAQQTTQMGSAMDALKYGWSGLYRGSSNSAAVAASTTNAIGSSGGGSQADLINNKDGIGSMYHTSSLMSSNSMKDYSNLQHDSLSNTSTGLSSKSSSYIDSTFIGGGQLKSASNYSADSLSRSYFNSAMALKGYNDHHQQRGNTTSVGGSYDSISGIKSFTPESGRTSSDSPDHTNLYK